MANGLKKQKQKWKALAKHKSSLVLYLITILSAAITVFVLGYLIVYILANGIPHLKPSLFAFTYTSDNVSMMPALINTVLMTLATLIVAVPLGIFAAIYLVEYAKKGNKLVSIIRVTAETLTGIPSIVYGLFGMLFFVGYCKWGFSLLSGALTLAIMVLPVIMRTTEEALMAVTDSYREGSFGLGAGKPANRISRSFAECRSGHFIRCYFGNRTNCWRDRSIDLYGWNNCKSAKQHF